MITGAQIEEFARRLAIANGHKDAEAEIVCVGGKREPVWRFYRDEAYDQLCRSVTDRKVLDRLGVPSDMTAGDVINLFSLPDDDDSMHMDRHSR